MRYDQIIGLTKFYSFEEDKEYDDEYVKEWVEFNYPQYWDIDDVLEDVVATEDMLSYAYDDAGMIDEVAPDGYFDAEVYQHLVHEEADKIMKQIKNDYHIVRKAEYIIRNCYYKPKKDTREEEET